MILVVAGYKEDMDRWLKSDGASGLSSRFPTKFELPNYSPEDLVLIAGIIICVIAIKLSEATQWKLRQLSIMWS